MQRNVMNDIYPVSEARRRFAAECWRWIYLPVIACLAVVVGIVLAMAGSSGGYGFGLWAQLATIVFAGFLIAAGLFVLPLLLAFVWVAAELLDVLPIFTVRMRMGMVIYSYRLRKISRGIHRIAGLFSGVLSPGRRKADRFRRVPGSRYGRKGGL
jgi:hypothetical protein